MAAALSLASPALADTHVAGVADYLKARADDADGQVAAATERYANAFAAAPTDPDVAVRTYREALAAGDYALAARAAAALQQQGAAPADTALLALAEAVHAGDRQGEDAAIDRIGGGPLDFLAPALRAWAAFDAHAADPMAPLVAKSANPLGQRYDGETRALLLIATGRAEEGVAALRAMVGADQASFDLRIDGAELLAGTGHGDLASALLAGDDPVLAALRRSIGDGVKPDFAFGMSRLFDRVAADLSSGDPTPLSVALTRASLRADPSDDRARLLLAEALAGDDATDAALATLAAVDAKGPFAQIAIRARIAVYAHAGDDMKALAAAQALAGEPDASAADLSTYGDQLIQAKRYGDAAIAYGRAIALSNGQADWSLYLQQGGALEEAGDWTAARPLLERAVAMAPNEPLALNYLGYADLTHGEDVAKARALLERASALKPGDPAITDSLGWAYFVGGDTARALPLFQQASQGQPADETINEHLGDAYWRSGRFFEARYAWRAASVYADPANQARLAGKIENGLGAGPVAN